MSPNGLCNRESMVFVAGRRWRHVAALPGQREGQSLLIIVSAAGDSGQTTAGAAV